ncbi:MAG: hypothetical protein B7Y56_12495 [Gallionellales bacterium 35-53-114]|nr:MAG: hypothetical protein B7Y56_12495 [Gallionellales bacterium 35-53-114]
MGRQGFIAIAIGSILSGTPLSLRDKGRSIRDFIYIDDLAEVLGLCGTLDDLPSIINIGSGKGYSLRDVVNLMEQLIGRQIVTVSTESRVVDIPISVLDIGLAQSVMSFNPTTLLWDGLGKTLLHHGIHLDEQ